MAADKELHMFDLNGYWMDVGQPKDYLAGTCLHLSTLNRKNCLSNESYVHLGNVMVHETAKIGKDCKLGPNVVIGKGVVIGDGVRLQRCVLMEGAKVRDFACVKNTIVGWHCTIGRWVSLVFPYS